jgi:hypothetical protein
MPAPYAMPRLVYPHCGEHRLVRPARKRAGLVACGGVAAPAADQRDHRRRWPANRTAGDGLAQRRLRSGSTTHRRSVSPVPPASAGGTVSPHAPTGGTARGSATTDIQRAAPPSEL